MWIERINRVGMSYFRPMIVASFMNKNATKDTRIELFREIERFVFIAVRLCGAYSTYNRNDVYKNAHLVASGKKSVGEAADQIRRRLEDWVHPATSFNSTPFKSRMQRLFETGMRKGFYDWPGLRYFLYEYEYSFVEKNANAQLSVDFFVKGESDKISTEHIFPQTPTHEYWASRFGMLTDEQQRRLNGSLGNLTLLSLSINSSLQNDSFPEKVKDKEMNGELVRRGYANGSHSEREISTWEEWTPQSILERGIRMIAFMSKRWNIQFKEGEDLSDLLFLVFLKD